MKKLLIFSSIVSIGIIAAFLIVSYQASYSHGTNTKGQVFEVKRGEDAFVLAERLEQDSIIASRWPFLWHLVRERKTRDIVAGQYALSGNLTVGDIVFMITEGKTVSRDIRVTFPEGWTSRKMADRLTANGLPGDNFLYLVKHPLPEWRTQFDFLSGSPVGASVEGFLFPDTYLFNPEASGQTIIETMLRNFDRKVDPELRKAFNTRNKNLFSAVTLASVVENEVPAETDRRLVSDLFLRRLSVGQPLQSDATIKYILGIDKIQHSFEETRVASPYNTYVNKGLPIGPVGNPGLASLRAVAFPESNGYFYFLSDPKTGETIFSSTYDEHVANKAAHGL